MREPIHVVTEDYDHYRKRRGYQNKVKFIFLFIGIFLALIIIYYVSIQLPWNKKIPEYKGSDIRCGMPMQDYIKIMQTQPDETFNKSGALWIIYNDNEAKTTFSATFEKDNDNLILTHVYQAPLTDVRNDWRSDWTSRLSCSKGTDGKWYG